jgi:hypothetical protein
MQKVAEAGARSAWRSDRIWATLLSMTLTGLTATLAVAGLIAGAEAPVKASVSAPGHTAKINTHWSYAVAVTKGGKPVAARITETIVDPIGGSHPVEFGKSTKTITNWPFKGVFKDFIIWPPSSRGIPLTLRISVKAGTVTKVIRYAVTPGA